MLRCVSIPCVVQVPFHAQCGPVPFLSTGQNKERELVDNLQLISQKEEIKQKTMKVQTLRTALQSMGLDQYET